MAKSLKPTFHDPNYEVVLALNESEAKTLLTVLRRIGGSALTSHRGHISPIVKALEGAGVTPLPRDCYNLTCRTSTNYKGVSTASLVFSKKE